MSLKAGYKGFKTLGNGLEYNNQTGHLFLKGESDITLDNLKDVDITQPLDGDILVYDSTTGVWYNEQIDSDPVEDSAKPVSSGGVYAALQNMDDQIAATQNLINDTVGWIGKNKITFPYKNVSFPYTNNGVKYECDDDGVITVTRIEANSNQSACILFTRTTPNNLEIEVGDYIGNGSPASSIPYIRFFCTRNDEAYVYGDSSNESDAPFTVLEGDVVGMMIVVTSGANPQGVKVKPMIRPAGITDPTFEPPHATVEDCKADNSVIAPVEDGSTVQNPSGYAVGSHAIRNGAFITWKNAKAQGETINDASDYTSGDVASSLLNNNLGAISDLSKIPFGLGYVSLSSAVSPSGATMQTNYILFGTETFKTLMIYWGGDHKICVNRYSNGAWSGWYYTTLTAV